MLIYDEPLLSGQSPLSGNSPYPEGGRLNPQVAMLSKIGFYYIYASFIYFFFETSVSSKNNSKNGFYLSQSLS